MADGTTRNNGTGVATPMRPMTRGRAWGEALGFDPLDLFRHFYSPLSLDATAAQGGLNIFPTESGYTVEIPVPGFSPEQTEVSYKENVLSVAGKNDRRSFTHSLMLPDDIDPDRTSARVEHGLLTLALQRQPEAQPKRIPVKVS